MKKLLTACFICVFLVSGCSVFSGKEKKQETVPPVVQKTEKAPELEPKVVTTAPLQTVPAVNETKKIKKADLYQENSELSLSAISSISKLDDNIKAKVNNYIKNSTVYYLNEKNGSAFMIVSNAENEKFQRHGVELVEISKNGTKLVSQLVKTSDENDDNDVWEFDEETKLPLRHVCYDADGEINYTEFWNYDTNNPVKYELKDGEGKTISLKKEIQDNASNLRIEHLVYDHNGNTTLNISANYDGADITRLTYFNSKTPEDGVIVMSQLKDGQKVKETAYSSDYKVKNVYEPFYEDGKLVKIKVFDNEYKELEEISSD